MRIYLMLIIALLCIFSVSATTHTEIINVPLNVTITNTSVVVVSTGWSVTYPTVAGQTYPNTIQIQHEYNTTDLYYNVSTCDYDYIINQLNGTYPDCNCNYSMVCGNLTCDPINYQINASAVNITCPTSTCPNITVTPNCDINASELSLDYTQIANNIPAPNCPACPTCPSPPACNVDLSPVNSKLDSLTDEVRYVTGQSLTNSTSEDDDDNDTLKLVGIIIGGVVLLGGILFLVWWFFLRKKGPSKPNGKFKPRPGAPGQPVRRPGKTSQTRPPYPQQPANTPHEYVGQPHIKINEQPRPQVPEEFQTKPGPQRPQQYQQEPELPPTTRLNTQQEKQQYDDVPDTLPDINQDEPYYKMPKREDTNDRQQQ